MFFSRKKGEEKAEEVRKLESKNDELENQLAEMKRRLARLENKEEEVKVSGGSKESAMKEVYEDQLQQLFQKKVQLEEKIGQVDKIMTEIEEIEKKKREAAQALASPPPLMGNVNNWIPPNAYFGNGPQAGPQGPFMPFPGPHQGGMMYPPGPHPQNNAPFPGPMGMQQPMHQPFHQMPGPPQPLPPRGPPSSFQRPQNNFQPNKGNNMQANRGGSAPNKRFNAPQKGQRNVNSDSQGQDNKNVKPSQNRGENKNNDLGKERPLFLDTNKNLSAQNQPKNKPKPKKDTPNEEKKSETEKETTTNDNKKQVKNDTKGKNKGPGNNQKNQLKDRKSNSNGPVHDRRTNFKASSAGRPHQRTRGAEGGHLDSDDTESSNSSGEESATSATSSSKKTSEEPKTNMVIPDLVKIEKKKEVPKEEISDGKNNTEKKQNQEKDEKSKKEKQKKKRTKAAKKKEIKLPEEVPLCKTNLGEKDVLLKFIGTSIPTLLDSLCLNINLNTRVTGVVLMSDPQDKQPILETPQTLFDIVNFKMKYPDAKSVLL